MVSKIPKSVVAPTENRNSSGATSNSSTDDSDVFVMVKSLMQTKDDNALMEFKREIDIFSKLSHENITKLFGLCREVEPHYMILEYTDWVCQLL